MKKHKIVSLLLISSILASVTVSVSADNEMTDIKKYILLDSIQTPDIDKFDTNNDGRINVLDICRIKDQILGNSDPTVTTTQSLQTTPTMTMAPETTSQQTTTKITAAPEVTSNWVTSIQQTQPTTTPAPVTTSKSTTPVPQNSAPETLKTTVTTTKAPVVTTTTKAPVVTTTPATSAAPGLDEKSIYNAMIAFKTQYPEGTPWTNDNSYVWNGGIYRTGYGCVGFAFMLSDAAFGKLPARKITNADVSDIRVGDILRVNNDTHSVIVLETTDEGVVLAEGNYNRSVHWGRKLTWAETKNTLTYVMTRYPD